MRLLVGGLLLLLVLPAASRAQDSVIVIDPDQPPGDSAVVRAGPAPDVVAELLALLQRQHDDADGGRRAASRPGARSPGALALYRGIAADRRARARRRHRHQRDALSAAGRGRRRGHPGGGRAPDSKSRRPARGPRAGHLGRGAGRSARRTGSLVLRERRRPLGELATARTSFQTGRVRTTLLLATGGTYNRIEGLPIVFGPTFELRPSEATARPARPARHSPDGRRGLAAQQRLRLRRARPSFASRRAASAGRVYSEVAPFEDQPLSAAENGWSAFLLQRDYRDWFERRGGGGYGLGATDPLRSGSSCRFGATTSARSGPRTRGRCSGTATGGAAIRSATTATTSPPASRSISIRGTIGTLPTAGWYLRGRYEHSTSDDVAPVTLPETVRPPHSDRRRLRLRPAAVRFPSLLAPYAERSASTPDCAPTGGSAAIGCPIQRRVSLGGPDLLPGYAFRAFTCAPQGFVDPRTAGPLRPLDRGPGRGPHPAQAQPRLSPARPRG